MENKNTNECLFCRIYENKEREIVYENEIFFSFLDDNPVSEGHVLIVPKFHIKSFFELDEEQVVGFLDALKKLKEILDQKHNPLGYNIGVNMGEVAGQTIFHLHVHLIPRYEGDVENPIGGVRNIIRGKGDYTKNGE